MSTQVRLSAPFKRNKGQVTKCITWVSVPISLNMNSRMHLCCMRRKSKEITKVSKKPELGQVGLQALSLIHVRTSPSQGFSCSVLSPRPNNHPTLHDNWCGYIPHKCTQHARRSMQGILQPVYTESYQDPQGGQSCTAPNETLASTERGSCPTPHTLCICGG